MRLTTHTGRTLDVEDEPDYDLAVVRYRIAKVGTVTLGREEHRWPDHDPALTLHMHYGAKTDDRYHGYDALPDQPRVFGVEIGGAAVFSIDSVDPTTWCSWLVCRRASNGAWAGGGSVPDGTRKRMAEYVAAIVEHHLARPDLARMDDAQARRLAPMRLTEAVRQSQRLQEEIETRQVELARWLHLADTQQDIISPLDAEAIPA